MNNLKVVVTEGFFFFSVISFFVLSKVIWDILRMTLKASWKLLKSRGANLLASIDVLRVIFNKTLVQ